MRQLTVSTARNVTIFMTDSADHVSGKTALTLTITASKDGAALASITPVVTELANGLYSLALTTTHTNTLGDFAMHITGTGADATDVIMQVVAYAVTDGVRLGLTALPNAAAEASGGLYTRGTGAGQINQDANGRVDINAKAWLGGTIPAVNTTGIPLVDAKLWLGGTIPAVNVTGVPKVDVVDWLGVAPDALSSGKLPADVKLWLTAAPDALSSGKVAADLKLWLASAPDALSSGKLPADVKLWLTTAPATVSTNGYVKAMVERWLTDDAGGTPNVLISGRVDANAGAVTVSGVDVNVIKWNGTTVATPSVAGIPVVEAATVESRLTSARAGYLDNLSAGAVALASALATAQTAITAIKAKTDNLPAAPADESLIIAATNALASAINTAQAAITDIQTDVDLVETATSAVKARTDLLPAVAAGAVGGLPLITAIGQGPGGQLKPNSFIDDYAYNANKKPTSWRVRIFATKAATDAAVAAHADNADGEVERYTMTATYNGDGTLATYKVDKAL